VNIKAALARNTVWYGLVTLVGVGSGLLTSIILARGLGPERMGDYSYVTWAWRAMDAVATLGFALATARYTGAAVARGEVAGAWGFVRYFMRRQVVATAVVVVAVTPLVLWLAPSALRWPLLVAAVALFPITIESIYTHSLYGAQRYDVTARLSTLKMALHILVTVSVLALGAGILGLVGALALTLIVSCWWLRRAAIGVYRTAPARVPVASRAGMRTYLVSLSTVAVLDAIVWDRSEVFFLGLWGDSRDIAYYSLAFGLATHAMILPEIAAGALLPAFSALHGSGNTRDFDDVYRTALRSVALAGVLTAALTAALSPGIVVVLYGEPYLPAAPLLGALVGVALVSALRQVAWAALPAVGDRRAAVSATGVAAVINIALAAWLIRGYGTPGAVVANAAGQLIAAVWAFIALGRHHGYRFPTWDLVKVAAAAPPAFLVARVVASSPVDDMHLGRLILGAASGAIVFLVACILTRAVALRELAAMLARTRRLALPSRPAA
jgi:O-antigen/teichoic acid export membrane protein